MRKEFATLRRVFTGQLRTDIPTQQPLPTQHELDRLSLSQVELERGIER